jgi:hypothetical protein
MNLGIAINVGQTALSGWSVISSGNFNLGAFLKNAVFTGFASGESVGGKSVEQMNGDEASANIGKQVGTILFDTFTPFLPPPLRHLFAVGNVIEAGKEALSGNWVDAGQNLLTAGMQFMGAKGPKDLGAKIADQNPTLAKAVKGLGDDISNNFQLKNSFKAAPATLVPGETPMVLQTKRQLAKQIQANTMNIEQNFNILNQEVKNEVSNVAANAVKTTGSWWEHLSSNFNAGRNSVAKVNSSIIQIPGFNTVRRIVA